MAPRHDEGFFSARDNLRLFWESDVPEDPKAHVAVLHGYADHSGRYRGIIQHLVGEGYAVHAFDYRGHGQSGGRRGHCDHFNDYLDDVDAFWARVKEASGGKKTFVLAHSHGALISVVWQKRSPAGLDGLILSAPYLKLALEPPRLKVLVAQMVGAVVPWLPVKNPLVPEQLTRDPAAQREVMKDHLYNQVVTPRWFRESNAAQHEAMALAPSLKLPIFVFCGSADPIASASATQKFFEAVGSSDKRLKVYEGFVHEPMNDLGKEQVWRDISLWISEHL
ncbi:MAG: alpha/beta hydrolase [Myxococcaceae bacterium]|nr:alpha/beta hydrolase [Myxococcaceae bacterium]